MVTLPLFASGVVLSASLIAAITDVWRFKVYNVLTLPLLISGLAYHGVVGGSAAFTASALGTLFAFVVLIGPYFLGALGAGDVKFLAGIGAWVGIPAMVLITLVGCLATGIYAAAVIIYHRRFHETWIRFQIVWHRLVAVGRYLGTEDEVESVQSIARQQSLPVGTSE